MEKYAVYFDYETPNVSIYKLSNICSFKGQYKAEYKNLYNGTQGILENFDMLKTFDSLEDALNYTEQELINWEVAKMKNMESCFDKLKIILEKEQNG